MNEPGSELSKLLPVTLARIPGLKYRALQEPNAATKYAQEVRLPPPEDKAVGFGLPHPYEEEAAIKEQMKRLKKEKDAANLKIKEKSAMEEHMAKTSLDTVKRTKAQIKLAGAQFVDAARAHAEAIRAPNASSGPDIVPYDAIIDYDMRAESPYPWRDQRPRPEYMLNLAQGG